MTPAEHLDALTHAMKETSPVLQVQAALLHFHLLRIDLSEDEVLHSSLERLGERLQAFVHDMLEGASTPDMSFRDEIEDVRRLLSDNTTVIDSEKVATLLADLDAAFADSEAFWTADRSEPA